MAEIKVTFHNKAELKVLAQIYSGFTLVSSCFVDPGQIRSLLADSLRFDIFFKNGTTGWEIARKLDSATENFTLSGKKVNYILT